MDELRNQQSSSKFSDLQEILKVLRKQKKVIAWTTVVCAVLTLFVSFFMLLRNIVRVRISWLIAK